MEKQVSIVIPAYNEEAAIGLDIDDIKETMNKTDYEYEIIVVDDGSTDNTFNIAKEKGVRVFQHKKNKGGGIARETGIKHAKYDIIVITDADRTYPVKDIPRLLEHIPEYDMVVGARTKEAGTLPLLRRPAKWFIRKLACFITGEKIPDLNSGFRAFKKKIALKFFNLLPTGHSWVSTITLAFLSNDYEVKYIPIDYYKRKGKSSFHPLRDTWAYMTLVVRTIMFFNPIKFFFPVTIIILAFGFIKFIYDWRILKDVKESDIMIITVGFVVGAIGVLADLIVKEHKHQYWDIEDKKEG
jgi:glycosyltransferase involved in cell wall biosynthesis